MAHMLKGGHMNSKEQAKRIYVLCVASAKAKETLTYGAVLNSLGYRNGVPGHAIRYGLELVLLACAVKGLPKLTSIVVNQSTGKPSPVVLPIDSNVFDQKEWPPVYNIDWDDIWDNRKQLSNKHSTPGYFGS